MTLIKSKITNKILCIICMRKGSKGIKNKNLLKVNKKPLMSYTINSAKNQNYSTRYLFPLTVKKF